jgi:hypothetical protein
MSCLFCVIVQLCPFSVVHSVLQQLISVKVGEFSINIFVTVV